MTRGGAGTHLSTLVLNLNLNLNRNLNPSQIKIKITSKITSKNCASDALLWNQPVSATHDQDPQRPPQTLVYSIATSH